MARWEGRVDVSIEEGTRLVLVCPCIYMYDVMPCILLLIGEYDIRLVTHCDGKQLK